MFNIICPTCGIQHNYTRPTTHQPCIVYVCCASCGAKIEVTSETANVWQPALEDIPSLEEGTVINVVNEHHPWHNEIGIIRDRKHKYYKIEILGEVTWLPENWIRENESNDTNP